MMQKTAIALGSFDGLHKGHMSVIACALSFRERGLNPIILLFDEHPLKVLKGKSPDEILQREIRDEILAELGIEKKIISFSDIKDMSPDEFFSEILIKKLNAGALCCGNNYNFGKNGSGDEEYLKKLCEENNVSLSVSPDIVCGDSLISSSRIRKAIEEGKIKEANEMLGRPFSYRGTVMHGCKRGRLIGAPTINQYFEPDFIKPKGGVYASITTVAGKEYPSVTNIGLRPTFENEDFRSETNILGFDGDLYGQIIEVKLIERIRDEKKFSSKEELKMQIKLDSEFALKQSSDNN